MAEDKAKKLLLIVNPVSGKKMAKRYMMKMINRFDEAGYSVTACCTQKNKNAYDITLSRGAGFDLIVCVGGDGTLKETVAGVMKLGKDIPLGFIPLGSTNDFAKSLGIPTDVSDAVNAIINGTPMPVDMGVCSEKTALYMSRASATLPQYRIRPTKRSKTFSAKTLTICRPWVNSSK